MNLDNLGQPAECTRCHKIFPSDGLIFEGAELEPICHACLKEVDGPRFDILSKIQGLRQPKKPD